MKHEKLVFVICLSICLFSMASVSASDVNDTIMASDNNLIEEDVGSSESPILEENPDGTYTDLANEISNAKGELNLTRNYCYSDSDSSYKNGINIDKSIEINGNGFTIDGKNKVRIFKISASNVTLNNICFKKAVNSIDYCGGGAIHWAGDYGVLSNCSFVNANNMRSYSYSGGGAISWSGSYGIMSNCSFRGCSDYWTGYEDIYDYDAGFGGAVYWNGTNAVLSNCSFMNCYVCDEIEDDMPYYDSDDLFYGGAVYWESIDGVLSNCSFVNCYSETGGAVYGRSTNSTLSNCSFVNCHAGAGGAVYWKSIYPVTNCSFVKCSSVNRGGAIYIDATLFNCSFVECSSEYGGAVYEFSYNAADLFNCNFVNCHSEWNGGAVHWTSKNWAIYNCSFVNSSSVSDGGAVLCSSHSYLSNGVLSNCSFVNSTAKRGSCVFLSSDTIVVLANCSFVNSHARAGGAVFWWGDNGVLGNCSFVNSTADEEGNAVYWTSYADNGTLYNCIFNDDYYSYIDYCFAGYKLKPILKINVNDIEDSKSIVITTQALINNSSVHIYSADDESQFNEQFNFSSRDNLTQEFILDNLSPGEYIVVLQYLGDDLFLNDTVNATFKMLAKAILNVSSLTVNYGDDSELVATLTDATTGNAISDVDVIVSLDNVNNTLSTNSEGQIKFPTKNLNSGNHTALISFNDNENYKSISTDVYVFVRFDPILTVSDVVEVYNSSCAVVATLKDTNGNIIKGVKVKLVVGDLTKTAKTDENGQVSLDISGLAPGTYRVAARSATTEMYSEAKSYAKATVNKITPTLTVPNVVSIYNTAGTVVATLKDDSGNAVSGVKVKVVVGDLSKIAKTDENGQVSLDISGLAPGEYKAAARSASTDIYNEVKAYAKAYVSADKVDTTLTIPNVVCVYSSPDAAVVATLKDAYGNILSGVKVKLVVGDVTKIAKTDENGQVSLDISDFAPGEYRVAARSAATDLYNEVKAYAKATVNKIVPTLTVPNVVVVGDSTGVVVATLKDDNGNAVSGVKVKLVVGDLTKTAKTDENGQISMDISGLAPGTYRVAARSANTDMYDEVKAYAKFYVSDDKVNTTLTIPNVEIKQGATEAVVATLKDAYGNIVSGVKVKLVVGDLTKTAKTDENGQISMDISGLAPGTYRVAARSATTDIYNECKAYAKANINAD